MDISIVIPAYNCENTILQTLESIITQNIEEINYEVIVVNDGSTDSTKELVDSFCKENEKYLLINKSNGGVSSARNTGISIAKGKYICFLDSDDIQKDDYIKKMINQLVKKNLDIVYCGYEVFNSKESRDVKTIFSTDKVLENYLKDKVKAQTNCWVFRKKVISENAINFNEDLFIGEDIAFIAQMIECSSKIGFVNQHLIKHRTDIVDSLSKSKVKVHEKIKWIIYLSDWLEKNRSQELYRDILMKYRLLAILIYESDSNQDLSEWNVKKNIWNNSNGLRSIKLILSYYKREFNIIFKS